MDAVCIIPEEKLEKSGGDPRDIFTNFFKKWNNNISSEEFGDIALKNSSMRSEWRHGLTSAKIASIEAIPNVILQGKVIYALRKEKTDVERIVVAAPIKIGSTPYYMGVMLQRDSQNQRLYLHDVVIKEETSYDSEADLSTTGAAEIDEHLFLTSILHNALNVKQKERQLHGGKNQRFSVRYQERDPGLNRVNEVLRTQKEGLREDFDEVKAIFDLLNIREQEGIFTQGSLEATARKLKQTAEATGSTKELTGLLQEAFQGLARWRSPPGQTWRKGCRARWTG